MSSIYYFAEFLLQPLTIVWDYIFSIPLNINNAKKIIIIDVVGGSYKTTLASDISRKFSYKHIRLDDCKFGERWKRLDAEEFNQNVNNSLVDTREYILEGVYSDPCLPEYKELVNAQIENADLIIWHDIPMWVSVYRKLFRSFKRRLGVVPQGSSYETLCNIRSMLFKMLRHYSNLYTILNNDWSELRNCEKFHKISWPYYYKVQ